MKNKTTNNKNSNTLLVIAVLLALSFFIFKRPAQKEQFVKIQKIEAVAQKQNSRAPASIPQTQKLEETPEIVMEKPAASEVEFIPDGQTREYYKSNIHRQEFYDQVIQQLYKDYEADLEKNKDTVSFVLAQNVFLFDHSLGMDHPQRLDYLEATQKMLQAKEDLADRLSSNSITTDYYRNQLHAVLNDYQSRCSEILDDQDYKKLFQLSKTDRFSENLGF